MNNLIEKVTRLLMDRTLDTFEQNAKDAIATTLDHFSEIANISDGMAHAFIVEERAKRGSTEVDCVYAGLAAAMKAAKDELK